MNAPAAVNAVSSPRVRAGANGAMRASVLFLGSTFALGGAETAVAELARRLDRRRFSPSFACLRSVGALGERLTAEGFEVAGPFLRGRADAAGFLRLLRFVRRSRPDVLYTLDHEDAMFLGKLAARAAGVRAVVTAVHTLRRLEGRRSIGAWGRLTSGWTDRWIAVAETQRDHLVHEEGLPAERVSVIENGVDLARFTPARDDAERAASRRALALPEDGIAVACVAALRPEKGHDVLLEAACELAGRGQGATTRPGEPGASPAARRAAELPPWRILFVGDGCERARLEAGARERNVQGRILFLGARGEVACILRAADLFVLPSRTEALPLSVLEAMAAGLPVVATRVGAVPGLLGEGDEEPAGVLAPPGDAGALAAALASLMGDAPRRARLGRSGRARAERAFDIAGNVRAHEALFLTLTGRG